MTTDKYGRKWNLSKNELCPTCKQPDSCGDCNHEKLTASDAQALGAINYKIVVHKNLRNF